MAETSTTAVSLDARKAPAKRIPELDGVRGLANRGAGCNVRCCASLLAIS
jgi:hypothetical protein